jgi:hypothetical protein
MRRKFALAGAVLVTAILVAVIGIVAAHRSGPAPGLRELTKRMDLVLAQGFPYPPVRGRAIVRTTMSTTTYTVKESVDDVLASANGLLHGPAWSQPPALKSAKSVSFVYDFTQRAPLWGGPGLTIVTIRPGRAVRVNVGQTIELSPQADPWTVVTIEDDGRDMTLLEKWITFLRPKAPPFSQSSASSVLPAPIRPGGQPVWPW